MSCRMATYLQRCPLHGFGRVPSEARLKNANERLADTRQNSLWPRNSTDSVLHITGGPIHEHFEQFFSALRVVRECSVREPECSRILRPANVVEHSGAVQRPEPEMAYLYSDDGFCVDGSLSRKDLDPT